MNRFWLFWFARTFSFYGDYIFSTTNIWFGLTQGGPMEVAYISATLVVFRALGSFLLAPIINYIGSRMMIVTSDLMRAALNVILWGAVFTDHSTLWLTLVINALSAFMAGGFESGMQAFIPTISAKLREANADLSRGRSVMQLLGYLTGGVLIQWFLGFGFLINAFTFIAAGIVSFYIGGGEPSVQAQTEKGGQGSAFRKYVGNWKLSWIAMQDSPTLRLAFWTALIINIMIIPMIALIAPLVSETSGGSGLMYSFVTSASVIGSLVGATWVRKSKIRDAYLILFGAMVCCLVGLVAGFSQIAIFLALTMLMYGLGQSIFNISESIAIQKCEPHLRASIAGIIQSTVLVGYPITMLTTARLVEVTSIRLPFVLAGVFSIVAVLICGWRWMVAEGSGKGNKNQEAEVPM